MTKSRIGEVFALIDVIDKTHVVLSLYVRLKHRKVMLLTERAMYASIVDARRKAREACPETEPIIVQNRYE